MLRAAAALDAGERLQRDDLRDVLAGVEAEILVADQRRNAAETAARQEDRGRAQQQVQMLGMRNQWQEDEQRERVQPPVRTCRRTSLPTAMHNQARYVTISDRISTAMTPDSFDTGPSHFGCTMKRRVAKPDHGQRSRRPQTAPRTRNRSFRTWPVGRQQRYAEAVGKVIRS